MEIAENVLELIGNTPMVKLKNASTSGANVFGKCEFLNPTHSVKDRIGANMIIRALEEKKINQNSTVIEATSGNTGIALASVCATLGIKLILTMPSSMSLERRKLLSALGANLILTKPELGMQGSIDKAVELSKEIENSFIVSQFQNPANPEAHVKATALEILRQMGGKVDIFVAAVGTGGTISGVGKVLKEKIEGVQVIAVEPLESAVLSGGKAGPHKIQGIGAGFVPKTLDTNIYDEIIKVDYEDAKQSSQELAKKEGLLVGISAGANSFASALVGSREENRGKNIVTILCDTGERYLSSGLYD